MQRLLERFNSKWTPEPYSGCWLWIGGMANSHSQYGGFSYHNVTRRAHRISWMLYRGDIPAGMLVCHRCDTPLCVNPDHLYIGTQSENISESYKKGRSIGPVGERHHCAKLTSNDVLKIRSSTKGRSVLASEFGVCVQQIGMIQRRAQWSHV